MGYLSSHGRSKPPLAAGQVDWAHPFVRLLLFGAWFNHAGVLYRGTGANNEAVIPTWGRVAPRLVLAFLAGGSRLTANAEGPCFETTNQGDYLDWGADPIPAAQVTICLIRKKVDTTLRTGFAFSLTGLVAAEKVSVGLPFSDGTTYWDFGGTTSGTTRLSVAGLTYSTTVPERWIFLAGSRGMAIWRNGVKVASHATASPGRTVNTARGFHLNAISASGGQQGDLQQFNCFMALDTQWDDALCRWWSAEPYAHLYGAQRRRLVALPMGAPAAVATAEAYVWGPL